MNQLITIDGLASVLITSTEEARQTRESLLASAATVQAVADRDGAEYASSMLKDIKAFTRLIDTTRSAVKAPILDQGRQIDALAKELSLQLEAEASRISRLLGGYTAEQERIADRARQEAQAKERLLAEETRKQAAAIMQSEQNKTAQQEAMDRLNADITQKVIAIRETAIEKSPVKLSGTATRTVVRFEVTDINLLQDSFPFLVVMTPNTSAINAALKGLQPGQTIPGIRHWTESLVSVR